MKQYTDSSNLDARIQLYTRFSTRSDDLGRWVFDRLVVPRQARLLELGCGTASLWIGNAPGVSAGWDVMLSDLSPGMVREARGNLADTDLDFGYSVIEAQAIPLVDSTLDAGIANHMLYYVPDRAKALSEIHRVLRPGGRLFATTMGRGHLRELHALVERVAPGAYSNGTSVDNFGLENGAEQLAGWFSEVELHRRRESLLVTEADALVNYVRSTGRLSPARLVEFERLCAEEILLHGTVIIGADVGMFEAVKEG